MMEEDKKEKEMEEKEKGGGIGGIYLYIRQDWWTT
jgi:hypothetical protein